MKFKLRKYEPSDLETLYRIDQLCYEPAIAYSRGELRSFINMRGADCIVGEAADETAGFIVSASKGRLGYVVTIDVLERYRRQHLGTLLLAEAEEHMAAAGVREIGLETAVNNSSGIAFWQAHGYRTQGMRKGYYPGGLDALSLRKTIEIA